MKWNSPIFLERILCPSDLTEESDGALAYAIALAETYRAKLFVLHCVQAEAPPDYVRTNAEKHLRQAVLGKLSPVGDPIHWEAIVIEDDPATAIAREAATRSADLIVMRSRRRPHAAALLGSTAEAVCRIAPCPVLVTHPEERSWPEATPARPLLGKVLVAHDFSDCSELAMSTALSLAQEFQSELHLIHVLPSPAERGSSSTEPSPESEFQEAARRLDNSIPAEARLWCEFRIAVRAGQPYREILAYAEQEKIDLICMGMRGAGFGMKALFGSNADRVLRQAPCPVLIARPRKPAVARLVSNGGAI